MQLQHGRQRWAGRTFGSLGGRSLACGGNGGRGRHPLGDVACDRAWRPRSRAIGRGGQDLFLHAGWTGVGLLLSFLASRSAVLPVEMIAFFGLVAG